MKKRMLIRGVRMGLGFALCLGTAWTQTATTPATSTHAPTSTPAPTVAANAKPRVPVVSPEAKVQREMLLKEEKVARDFSAKRYSTCLAEAREWERKRREEEAKAMSRNGTPADSGHQGGSPVNIGPEP